MLGDDMIQQYATSVSRWVTPHYFIRSSDPQKWTFARGSVRVAMARSGHTRTSDSLTVSENRTNYRTAPLAAGVVDSLDS